MREGRNQIYSHYESWEHWIAGMFGPTLREPVVGECVSLLMSPEAFEAVLAEVAAEWPNAVAQHLSNANQNHQPWCGRLACGYEFGASIREVNHAWFAGFAPHNDPKIVVVVFLEYGLSGTAAARVATKVMEHYLKVSVYNASATVDAQ